MREILYNRVVAQQSELPEILSQARLTRSQTPVLIKSLSSPLAKVITGPRRAGKSTLAVQALQGRQFAYFNFEDEQLPEKIDTDLLIQVLHEVYGKFEYVLFDEIQHLERWEQFINRLHRNNYNIVITGSNSKLLEQEYASALTGRHLVIELLPFGPSELSITSNEGLLKYLIEGGFPDIHTAKADFRIYLATLWDSVVLKDIVIGRKIRTPAQFQELLLIYLNSIATRHNYDSLSRAMYGKISAPTVKKYLKYSVEAYLAIQLLCFSRKPKLRYKQDTKGYVIDNGFYAARVPGLNYDYGRLLENSVLVELMRRGHRPGLDLFYYITERGHEVDFFILRHGQPLELIQVALDITSIETKQREIRSLLEAGDELKVKKLSIITLSTNARETIGDKEINIIQALKWFSPTDSQNAQPNSNVK